MCDELREKELCEKVRRQLHPPLAVPSPREGWLDRQDAGARPTQELRDQEANDSLSEDRDDLAETRLGVEHDVDRRLEIGEEHTLLRCGAIRQPPDERLGDDVLVLMRMQGKD